MAQPVGGQIVGCRHRMVTTLLIQEHPLMVQPPATTRQAVYILHLTQVVAHHFSQQANLLGLVQLAIELIVYIPQAVPYLL